MDVLQTNKIQGPGALRVEEPWYVKPGIEQAQERRLVSAEPTQFMARIKIQGCGFTNYEDRAHSLA